MTPSKTSTHPHKGYVLIGNEPVLMQAKVAALIQNLQTHLAPIPLEKKIFYLETSDDWTTLLRQTKQRSFDNAPSLLDVRFHKNKLDHEGTQFLEQFNEDATTFLMLQAPLLSLKQLPKLQPSQSLQVIEIKPLKGKAFVQWIAAMLQQAGITYASSIPHLIADLTTNCPLAAMNCIQQVGMLNLAYCDEQALRFLLQDVAVFPVYALSDACLRGHAETILRILRCLQHAETEPLIVLWALAHLTRQLFSLYNTAKQGIALQSACKTAGIWTSQVTLYQQAVTRLSHDTLKRALLACQTLDVAIKSHASSEPWRALSAIALLFIKTN